MGNMRNIAFWFVLFILLLFLFRLFSGDVGGTSSQTVGYSDFVQSVKTGQVSEASLDGESVRYVANGDTFSTIVPGDANVSALLIDNNVRVVAESQRSSPFQSLLITMLPILLLIGVWIFFMNRMQGGGRGGAMGFGKSKAKL
ncbi:MAG: ATP-dependent metallopeptidase FtsH/Yme1/Tma family protein, partial [Planktomarina sp.]